jgi:uncharacterized protein YodC (DUF2158 family)
MSSVFIVTVDATLAQPFGGEAIAVSSDGTRFLVCDEVTDSVGGLLRLKLYKRTGIKHDVFYIPPRHVLAMVEIEPERLPAGFVRTSAVRGAEA